MRYCIMTILLFCNVVCSAQLKANFTASVTAGCTPLFVQFTDSSSGVPTSWQWDFGNGQTSSNQSPGAIYSTPGTYTVKLVVQNATGKDSIIKTGFINVYDNPAVDFQFSPASGCTPLNVQFTDKSTDPVKITEWIWDYGDGHSDSVQNPAHTYTTVGSFSVILKVTNSGGCSSFLQKTSIINTGGVANPGFNYSYTNSCTAPTAVSFQNTTPADSSVNFQWYFGDGGSTNAANPSYTYNANGVYNVQLIASTSAGCRDTVTKSISIGTVTAYFALPSTACTDSYVVFSDSSTPKPITATWYFGDGFTATGENVGHIYGASGSYPVKLVANFGGCVDSLTQYFNVGTKPSASFTSTGNPKSCALPGIVQFQNTSTNALKIQWNFGDGQSSIQHNPLHTYKNAGFYTVKLIALSSNGCSDTLVAQNYVELGPPVIDSIVNSNYTGCVPATVDFSANILSGDPVTKYFWNFGDGSAISTTKKPTHVYVTPGSYSVSLKVITATGCSDSAYFADDSVIVGNKPTAKFKATPLSDCASDTVKFTDESAGKITAWNWNFGDGVTSTIDTPWHLYYDTGYFTITLAVTSNGCSDTITAKRYIYVKPPIANFSIEYLCQQNLSIHLFDNSIGANTWHWDFGDGDTSSLQNPANHVYNQSGTYPVKLTVTSGTCIDTTTTAVTVTSQNVSFTYKPANNTICRYDTIQFIPKNFDSIPFFNLFFWDFADGGTTTSGINSPNVAHRYVNAGTYVPYLVVEQYNGCDDTIKIPGFKIAVFGPSAAFTNTDSTCINRTVTFNDHSVTDGIHPIVKWFWDFGDGNSETVASPPFTHKYGAAGTYEVKLRVTDSYGCFDTATKYNTYTAKPVAAFSSPDSIVCLGSTINFADSSTGVFLTYNWNFGDGDTSHVSSPNHQYVNGGVYSLGLGVTDEFGCKDSISKTNYITVSNPKAQFNLSDTVGLCPPLEITPQNTSTNYSFLVWKFGDGNTSNAIDPVHYYSSAGTYTLQLITQGYGNCYDSISKQIILKGPYGTLTYSPLVLCDSGSVNFAVVGNNVESYNWDFADGNIDSTNLSNRSHVYTVPGLYLPKVIIRDSAGCNVTLSNISDTIRVIGASAGFTAQTTPGCDSAAVTFTNNSAAQFDTLASSAWSFSNGGTSSFTNPTQYFSTSGTYTATLKITTNFGCTSTISMPIQVVVHNSPVITDSITPTVCLKSIAYFSAASSSVPPDTLSWHWTFGDGDSSVQQNPTYTYTQGGTFTVTVTATNQFGCTDSVNKSIVVKPLPIPVINAGVDSLICPGQSILLQPTGAVSYIWAPNPTLSCTNCATPLAAPDSSCWYYVTGTSSIGCNATDSVEVIVKKPYKLLVNLNDTLCPGSVLHLTASGADIYDWQPSTGLSNPNIADPIANPASTTMYTLITEDTKKCFVDTAHIMVNVYTNPTVNIVDSLATIIAGSSYVPSSITSPDVIQWLWQPATGLSCNNCAQPTLSPGQTTRYEERVYNQYGCSGSDFITVQVLCDNGNLYIPNTFSPNGDGMNDYFYPRGKGLYSIKAMRIFNRWGQAVFEKVNFSPNDISSAWDGKFNGQPLPTDVYVYIIEVICSNSTVLTSKGTITLLR